RRRVAGSRHAHRGRFRHRPIRRRQQRPRRHATRPAAARHQNAAIAQRRARVSERPPCISKPRRAIGRRSLRDGLSGKAPDADDQGECDRNRDEQPTHETASVCRTSFPPKTVYGALIVLLFALLIIEILMYGPPSRVSMRNLAAAATFSRLLRSKSTIEAWLAM